MGNPSLVFGRCTFYGPSVQAMDTQLDALPTLAVRARTVSGCLNSAFLGLFSTICGPSFQAMDTQLNALPTLPVLARTVSGCLNSAFLNISQHFTAHLFRPWIPNSMRCQHFLSSLGAFLAA